MKIRFHLLLGISLSLVMPITVYGAPVSAPAPLAANALSGKIGIAAAVRGTVKISNKTQVGKIVSSGENIFLGDEVSTDAESNLQILLLDETIFTIGPNSGIVIDKFIYDPSTHDGEVKAKVVKGVFRFVTGKIGQKNPQQMEVDLPSGTIGIRGTIVVGQSVGGKSLVALLGPGSRNNTPHKQGSFVLSNGSNQETVNKTGFGSTIDGNGAPSKPFQVPAEQLSQMTSALGTGGGGGSSDSDSQQSSGSGDSDSESEAESEDSPTESAGQDTAIAGDFVKDSGSIGKVIQDTSGESDKASQDAIDDELDFFDPDGITRWEDIANAPNLSGAHHYNQTSHILLSNGTHTTGHFTFDIEIHFTDDKIGGGSSKIYAYLGSASANSTCTGCFANGTAEFPIDEQFFGSGKDFAVFSQADIASVNGDCSGNCGKADVDMVLFNSGGNVAQEILVAVDVKNNSGAISAGTGAGFADLS